MRQLLIIAMLLATLHVLAQHTVIEESLTEVVCENATHATTHHRQVVTILNEQGADNANFVCSCSKDERLTSFRGQATNAAGSTLRKFRQGDLQRTEYSQYLAIDDYKMFVTYTPPVYPVTITYEWTMESRNTLIEFPWFCPQDDYGVSVRKAVYQLTAPRDITLRHALQNISQQPVMTTDDKGCQVLTLTLNSLPALKKEPLSRPLRERLPMAYFAPQAFTYYGTKGSLASWRDFGLWQYSLLKGRDVLPDPVKAELHSMTDTLPTARQKVEALYRYLEQHTRYVAVLLGIGGLQPAPASDVARSGFGDCKGLSNFMRAMLHEVGIAANYTVVSTRNRRLLSDFASVGQMNHVVLQVPLPQDTLWLECTNPQLPLGFVHDDIADHDAVVVSAEGGRLVRLPAYADTANTVRNSISIALDAQGAADITAVQAAPPKAVRAKVTIPERVQHYAALTGQRMFVPLCPIHQNYAAPAMSGTRTEPLCIIAGFQDEDEVSITLPEGFRIEALPADVAIEKPFGTFRLHVAEEDGRLVARYRMLVKSGTYDKALYADFVAFIRSVAKAYAQKVVLYKG